MNSTELPLLISCADETGLVGILHQPEQPGQTGIVVVVAGGPQYRVGFARQILLWSRRLAQASYPVLRFDYRGFGDSTGLFAGFEHIDEDIKSAIDQLCALQPQLTQIVLWGECNAASAIMMYAWQDPRVTALILQNPWVRSETTQARAYIRHYYLMRIMQKSFWLNLLNCQFNPVTALASLLELLKHARKRDLAETSFTEEFSALPSYQEKMRVGLAKFSGKMLLLMSGHSLIGKEFDELVAMSPAWQNILETLKPTRIELSEADHTFSRSQDRDQLVSHAIDWLHHLPQTAANPLVSVIVPTRNRAALLGRCLAAIARQSYPNLEVLILDDGSNAENRSQIKQLLQGFDERFSLHEIHAADTRGSGVSIIRNYGLSLASGEYVAFCDDDDHWCQDDHVSTAVQAMRKCRAQAYFAAWQALATDGQILNANMMAQVTAHLNPQQRVVDCDVYRVSKQQILTYPDYAHLDTTIASKALLEKLGGFWEHSHYAEDISLFIRLCDSAEVILFRPTVCASHYAPAHRQDASVSNTLSIANKRLLELHAFQHLLAVSQSQEALRFIRRSLADLYKVGCEAFLSQGQTQAALVFARAALAAWPSYKWAGYSLFLHLVSRLPSLVKPPKTHAN